jgi:hypothetical protein
MSTYIAFRRRGPWLVGKVLALLVCAIFGFRVLEAFLIYSSQAGAFAGRHSPRPDLYAVAWKGQLLTLTCFVASQALAGCVLRAIVLSPEMRSEGGFKSVLQYAGGFTAASLVIGYFLLIGSC